MSDMEKKGEEKFCFEKGEIDCLCYDLEFFWQLTHCFLCFLHDLFFCFLLVGKVG